MAIFDNELIDNQSGGGELEVPKHSLGSPTIRDVDVRLPSGGITIGGEQGGFGGYTINQLSEIGLAAKPKTGFDAPMAMIPRSELLNNQRYGTYVRDLNLENIYSLTQPWYKQLGNGIAKMGATAFGTFAQSFATIPNTVAAIKNGSLSDLSNVDGYEGDIDNWLKRIEDEFPNYVSTWEKEHPWAGILPFTRGSANFWGDKIIKNIGFTAGAIAGALVQDAAIGLVTQGVGTIPMVGAQIGKASLWLNKVFTGTNKLDDLLQTANLLGKTERQILNMKSLAYASEATKLTNGFRYGLSLYGASRTEAAVEARDAYRQVRETLVEQHRKENNGLDPEGADLAEIENYATDAMNTRFGINMALLTASNSIQFSSLFKSFTNSAKGVPGSLERAVSDAGKVGLAEGSLDVFEKKAITGLAPKVWDAIKPTVKNIFAEGVYEEGGQYAAEKGVYDYYTRKYKNLNNPDYKETWDTLNEVVTSTNEGLAAQFGSTEGLQNMLIGGITALLTGVATNKIEKARGAQTDDEKLQTAVNILNRHKLTGVLKDQYENTLNSANIAKEMEEAAKSGNVFRFKNLKRDQFFTYVMSRVPSDMHDVTIEQLKMLKDLDKDQFEKTFGMSFDESNKKTVNDYVDSLITKADQIKKSYDSVNFTFKNPYRNFTNPTTPEEIEETEKHDIVNEWKTNLVYYPTVVQDVNDRLANLQGDVSAISPMIDTDLLSTITKQKSLKELRDEYESQANDLSATITDLTSREDKKRIRDQVKALRTASEKITMAINSQTLDTKDFESLLNFELSGRTDINAKEFPTERTAELYQKAIDVNSLKAIRESASFSFDQLSSREGFEKFFKEAQEMEKPKPEEEAATTPTEEAPVEFVNKAGAKEAPEVNREYEIKQLPKASVTKLADDRYQVTSPTGEVTFYDTEAKAKEAADEMNDEMVDLGKVKILAINPDGTVKIEDSKGNIQNIDPKLLTGYERIETASEKIEKNKEQIEKEQTATELNSGNVGSTPVQEGAVITEGKLKDYRQLFTSGITESEDYNDPTQSAPHVKRSREFLNNAKNFKNRNKLAVILVTPNQEVALGLSGLTQLSYGTNDMSDSTNVDTGFVAQVFVETDGGKVYFVDKDGNRIGEVGQPVDLQQVVFQTMPTTSLTDSQGNPRYRANQKTEAEAQQRGWTAKRGELFAAPAFPVKAYQFTISRGVRRENKIDGKYERSNVGGILIPEEKIATTEGLLKISEGTISHNGVSITIPRGYTVLQYGDTLDIVNNNKFGQKKAKTIYEVLKAFAEDIRKQSEAGQEVRFNRNYTTFLENVLYWRKTADTQGNQIYVDSSNIYLGGNRYPIADVANLESEIVDQLANTYHNINGKTLSSKFSEPFYEYVLENGNLAEKEWRNYQSYLLSSEGRSAQETPLVTNAAKPTAELPYSFKQKYATLVDFELPVVAAPAKPATPGVPMIGEFEMNGTTVNTFNGFNSGPIDFTGTVAPDGGISVDVKPNKTITEVADNKQVVNGNIVPALKDANLFDPTADDNQLVITYIANRLIVELDKLRGAQQQQAPAPTAPTAAPASTVEAKKSLGQELISFVWDRLSKQGVTNADSIIGTRETIDNVDFNKFWSNVTKEDLQNLKKQYETKKKEQLDLYKKFKGAFDPSTGTITSNDTSFFDNKIKLVDAELTALEGVKSAEGTYNPNDTGAPADDYMRVAPKEEGGERLTDAEIELFRQWATENVPGIPFEILDNLVNTYDNQKAWGVFEDGVAKFYRGALKGTPYHEVFEGIWKGFLTSEQRQAILDEFRAKSGKFKDRASGKMIFYEEATDQQAKERIADDFASFRTGKIAAKSLGQKILDFFKKIIEFFKSFVRKPSLKNELFKAIDSGKFKEAKLPAGIESTRPEYQRIAGISETQTFEFTQDMTARAANYIFGDNKKSLYDIKEITSKEIFDKIKEAYTSENKYQQLGDERYNQLVKRSKEALRTLGINFNEEDRIDINDESVSKNDYAPEPFNVDWKKNSPFAIKFVLATLPQVEPMNQQNSTSMSLPKRVISGVKGYLLNGFNRAFATVLDKMSNTSSVAKATEKLSDLAKFDATYVRFFQRVGGDLSTGTFDFSKFKDEDWRLFVNFMQTFTRQKPDALIQYIKGNEVYTAPANQYTAAKELERQWLESIKAISTNPEAAIRYNRVTKTYEANLEVFPERVPKNPDQMVQFLGNVGIQFPLESYVRLRGEQQEEFATAVSRIYDYLKDARTGEMTSKGLKISGPLSTLSNLFIKSTNPNQDSTYFGVQGQRIQSFTDNNAPSLFENEFNESETIEELLTKRPELNDVFSKNSVTLKKGGRFVNEEGKIVGKFKVSYIQGTKNITQNAGKTTSEVSIGDRFTQEINQNINGNYYILVPADGSTEWMMNLGNHVSFADIEGGARGWNKLYTIFKGYLKDDIALAMDYKNREDLKSVGAKARELRFFKDILAPKNLRDINALILRDATETEINDYINNNISDINESVKSFIESTADQTISTLKDNSQVLMVKEGIFDYPFLDSQFAEKEKLNKFKLSENDLKNIATFVNANYIINNIEFHKILFGDPYQFAIKDGKLDETKRIKSFLSPRRTTIDTPEFNTFLNEDYNKSGDVSLQPGDPGYHVHKDHAKTITFEDVEFGTSTYPKVNEADAASWIMDNTYREVKLKNGQWNKDAEAWHQWQMAYMRKALAKKGRWSYEGREALQNADNELLSKPEPTFVTEVLKPIVSGVKTNENKIDLVLDKFSQMPLYYKAIEGTNLEKLYLKMMGGGIGYAVMQSGRKVGATKLNKFYTADGKFNEAPFEGIVSVPWKAYGIQVENSFESEKEQTRGSQLTKLFSLDFFDNGKASEDAKSEFEKNRSLLKQLHEQGYNQLLKKLGITDLGDGFELKDKKAIQETLEYEMLRRELSNNAKDTIQLDENGEFRIPFEASPSYQQIKDILYSLINKSLVSPKMNGGPKVQVPVTGFEKGDRDPNAANSELKFYTKEDPYMEVYLPHWFRNKFNKRRFPTDESILNYLNKTEEGKKILTGIGFRIPTQSMSSVEVFRVKGFLPQSMGDTIVVPSEVTAKAGSDFDIDKMNTYLRSVYVDKSGNVRLVKYKGSEEATREFYGNVFDEVLAGKAVKKDDLFEALQIRKYDLDDPKNLVDRYGNLLDTLLSEVEDEAELEAKLEQELLKLGDKNLQARLKDRFVDDMYKRSLENEYYDSLERMITLPENFERLISPVNDAGLKDTAQELDELRGEDETKIKNRLLDRNYMTDLRHSFVTAKKWVGIAAVNITGQSLTQKSQVYIDPARFTLVSDFDQKWLGDGSIVLPHNKVTIDGKTYVSISGKTTADGKQFISDRLSGYATSFVDVAKDPYIMKIIKSDSVVGVFMFLERIGAGENAIWFMNQPIVTEYLRIIGSTGGRGLFSKANITAALSMFPARTEDVKAAKIDVAKLKENIQDYSKGALGGERNAEQQKILMEFLKYAKMANYSFKLTQATNYDTTKFRNSDSFSRKATRTDIANQTNIFSSADKILESSFIGDQKEMLDKAMSAMGEVLKLEKDNLRIITDDVLRPYSELEYLSKDDFDRIASKLKASFLDYIIQTKTGLNLEIKDLIVDLNTSVAAQLVQAQKNHPEIKILNDLTVISSDKLEGGAKTIKLKANVKDAYDENMYTEMMRELRDNPDTRDLYYDIVTLSILQGTYQSAVSIKNIIPVEDFSDVIKPIIDTLQSTPEVQLFSNGMFQRNNWKDEAIVPSITPFFRASEEPVGMILVGNEEEEVFKYSSPSFPNLPAFGIKDTDRRVLLLSETYNSETVQYDFVKVPRVVKTRTGAMLDMQTGRSIFNLQKVRRIASGETALNDVYGYQKVKYANGDPVVTAKGEHVYKLVNLYGDGALVSEYYNDGRMSVIDNNTVKIDTEIPDADLIRFFAPRIETKAVPSTGEIQSMQEASIAMQPFNIEKIKAGTKTTTTRSQREFEKIGIPVGQSATVNFGGQNFTVTNRGLLTIQEAGGEEAMLKSEGYASIDDLLYQQTKDWFGGRGKLYVYDIKPATQTGQIAPDGLPPINNNNENSCG